MIDYTVIRSRRRTLALEVTRQGTALVRAPLRASDADITRFVDSHRGWLEKHLAARQAFLAAHPEPSAAQADAWRQQAKETLPPLVAHWAQRMGVQPAGITVTAARTRFGSCSGKSEFGAVGIGDSGASPYIGSSPLKIESGIVRGVDRNIFCLTSCKYQRQKKEIEYFFRFHNMLF